MKRFSHQLLSSALFILLMMAMASLSHAQSPTAPSIPPDKILFIGNSFTFYNNGIHTQLNSLLSNAKPKAVKGVTTQSSTLSSAKLVEHAASFTYLLKKAEWDIVVLQGHSLEAISSTNGKAFARAVKLFANTTRDAGAEPLLFMTWAYSDKPEMTTKLDRIYSSIGRKTDTQIAPIGLAFAAVNDSGKNIKLIINDKKHPTMAGTYLAACVIYSALYQQSPADNGYNSSLSEETAKYLRETAWQVTQDFYQR